MFLRTPPATALEVFINNFFVDNKTKIMNLHAKQWLEEDIREYSKVHYDIISYYAALHLVILIWLELQDGVHTDWTYYVNKYDLVCKKDCLACKQISLDNILKVFGLPTTLYTSGIEAMEIEKDFIVEPTDVLETEIVNVDIQQLIDTADSCYNYMNTACSPLNTDTIIPSEIPFVMPITPTPAIIYYGVNASPTLVEADVLALSSVTKTSVNGLYSFNVGGYKWIAFPASLGTPVSILDNATQLNMVMQAPTVITINLSSYNLYRSTNILGSNITMKVI